MIKKLISLIGSIVLIIAIVIGVKYVFIDVDKKEVDFNRIFTLGQMDYAKVSDEITVKLLQIKDNRCLDEDCEREGQFLYKLLVYDKHKIAYVELGSMSETSKDIKKLNCSIKFEGVKDDDHASFRVTELKEK